jgi:hypothetical protein
MTRDVVVFLTDDLRVEDPAGGGEWIDGRVDSEFGDPAVEDGGASRCVKVVAGAGSVISSAGT